MQIAYRVTEVKHTPIIVGGLLWKPFESRFKELLEQLDFHRELVKDEFLISQFQQAEVARRDEIEERRKAEATRNEMKDLSEATKRDLQDEQRREVYPYLLNADTQIIPGQMFRNIQQWLSPPSFIQELELAQDLREEGTALWLFDESTFVRWKGSETSMTVSSAGETRRTNLLWLHGKCPISRPVQR